MKDINNPLIKAYYDALKDAVPNPSGGFVPVYEGEEPDNELSDIYIVINDISSNDISTKNSTDHDATIQLSVHSWRRKYNNKKSLNQVCGSILEIVLPTPQSTLQAGGGINIITSRLSSDNTQDYGKLAERVFISRILIFSHIISY